MEGLVFLSFLCCDVVSMIHHWNMYNRLCDVCCEIVIFEKVLVFLYILVIKYLYFVCVIIFCVSYNLYIAIYYKKFKPLI